MPLIIRSGDVSQGHCWPPTTPVPNATTNVFLNNRFPVLVGDLYLIHPGGCGNSPPHVPTVTLGSPNVFINNIPVLRDGDLLSCGDIARSQNGNIFVN